MNGQKNDQSLFVGITAFMILIIRERENTGIPEKC
jgi:hypothetical protein